MKYKISFILIILLSIIACKNEEKPQQKNDLQSMEMAAKEKPNGENISKLLAEYNKVIHNQAAKRNDKKEALEKAYSLTKEQGWDKELIGFISTYLKEFPGEANNEEKVVNLIQLMKKRNQKGTVNALSHSFLEAYPSSTMHDSIKTGLDTSYNKAGDYLKEKAERVFDNPGDAGVNAKNSREYVNACEAYALVLPQNEMTPRYLFNAAEMSRTIRTFEKTLYLYDWIIDKYPQYEKAPMALFLKGFIIENDLKNMDLAKDVYRQFLVKFPQHDMADDVQFLLDNIGKSNEEILEMIEKNKQGQ